MTACVNCNRALQPAWKYCIYCGTRTAVAAAAPRSRPLPKRTPVPGYAVVTSTSTATGQTPIVPPPAPAPLSAAPVDAPVSSEWPDSMGERPSLRSALVGTAIPAPTPPREDAPAPAGEQERAIVVDEPEEPAPEPAAEVEEPLPDDDEDDVPGPRRVNTLAVLALAIGILASPLAALFGHLALGQLKASGERGVIPAWVAVVLGYLWLGFWIVFGVSFFATNG
jgi:hypothetical protein